MKMKGKVYKEYCFIHPNEAYDKAWRDGNLFIRNAIREASDEIRDGSYPMFCHKNSYFSRIVEIVPQKVVLLQGYTREHSIYGGTEGLVIFTMHPETPLLYKAYKLEGAVAIKNVEVTLKQKEVVVKWEAQLYEPVRLYWVKRERKVPIPEWRSSSAIAISSKGEVIYLD